MRVAVGRRAAGGGWCCPVRRCPFPLPVAVRVAVGRRAAGGGWCCSVRRCPFPLPVAVRVAGVMSITVAGFGHWFCDPAHTGFDRWQDGFPQCS